MKKIFLLTIICSLLFSCRKAVEVNPPDTGLVSKSVYEQNSTAEAAVTAIFSLMAQGGMADGQQSISCDMGLSADELVNFSSDITLSKFYSNSLVSNMNPYFWPDIYQKIYIANSAIEGLTSSTTLSFGIKQQLLGEAKFIRAFQYFYAVNLYGDVPLTLTTDFRINIVLKRSPQKDVYAQIIADLKDAQILLSDDYKLPTGKPTMERVRPNKATATALLARVYLYQSDWVNAEQQANSLLINNTKYALESNLNNTFLTTSTEAIWQLYAVNPQINTNDGTVFILIGTPSESYPVALSSAIIGAFEPGDNRFNNWVGIFQDTSKRPFTNYYYPYKYKQEYGAPITEYQTLFRLAEQYLIRAEAEIQQNKVANGVADLNVLRRRARAAATVAIPNPLPDLPTNLSKADALTAVLHERQVELFTEWGHRWFDLKRTGNLDAVMSSLNMVKNRIWTPDAQLLPIPRGEIIANPNLIQNKGYN